MPSKKQLATAMVETTEEVQSVELSTVDKCQQLCEKCDVVLDKIKIKKAKRNKTLIEIK